MGLGVSKEELEYREMRMKGFKYLKIERYRSSPSISECNRLKDMARKHNLVIIMVLDSHQQTVLDPAELSKFHSKPKGLYIYGRD